MVFGITSSASAQADGPTICVDGACVWFQAEGEHFYVSDTKADGHSAYVQIQVPAVGIYTKAWNTQGYNTTLDYNASYGEGNTVYYRACIGEWSDKSEIACNPGYTHGTS